LPNVQNLVVSFKHHLGGGYIDNILELKSNNCYNYIEECCFIAKFMVKRSPYSRGLLMEFGVEWGLLHECNSGGIWKTLGSSLTMSHVVLLRQWWFAMFMIRLIRKLWPLQFVTCNYNTLKHNKSCGQSSTTQCSSTSILNQTSKDSWWVFSSQENWIVVIIVYGFGDAIIKMHKNTFRVLWITFMTMH
jgi:hypothetical protein